MNITVPFPYPAEEFVGKPCMATEEDVAAFFDALFVAGVNFHPDIDFTDVSEYGTGEASFSVDEAARLNALLSEAHAVCMSEGVDIYGVCLEVSAPYLKVR